MLIELDKVYKVDNLTFSQVNNHVTTPVTIYVQGAGYVAEQGAPLQRFDRMVFGLDGVSDVVSLYLGDELVASIFTSTEVMDKSFAIFRVDGITSALELDNSVTHEITTGGFHVEPQGGGYNISPQEDFPKEPQQSFDVVPASGYSLYRAYLVVDVYFNVTEDIGWTSEHVHVQTQILDSSRRFTTETYMDGDISVDGNAIQITSKTITFDADDTGMATSKVSPQSVDYGEDFTLILSDFLNRKYFTEEAVQYVKTLINDSLELLAEKPFDDFIVDLDEYNRIRITLFKIATDYDIPIPDINDLDFKWNPTITYNLINCEAQEFADTIVQYNDELDVSFIPSPNMDLTNPKVKITMGDVDISYLYEKFNPQNLQVAHVTNNIVINLEYKALKLMKFYDSQGELKYTYNGTKNTYEVLLTYDSTNQQTNLYIDGNNITHWNDSGLENEKVYGYGTKDNDIYSLVFPFGKNCKINTANYTEFYPVIKEEISTTDAFELNLFNMLCEKNQVDKSLFLKQVGTLTGTLREACSVMKPVIRCEFSNVPKFNYVYIPSMERYYFVEEITFISKNIYDISLRVDVLMSFRNEIKSLTGVVARNEFEYDDFIVDEQRKISNAKYVEYKDIPLQEEIGFNEDSMYIVGVVRG